MNYIEIKAPCKINLGLYVTEKRPDGFHNIHTLFYPVYGLYDFFSFEKKENFEFECNDPKLPKDEKNLVIKALKLLESYSGKKLNVKIICKKNIPAGAGLGGGSSDAATTLLSLNELFRLNISYERLLDLALQLGSDVPFFLKCKPAIGESRGEKLTHVDLFLEKYFVLVNPGIHISTAEAFKHVTPHPSTIEYSELISSPKFLSVAREKLTNVFEPYAIQKHPEIKNILNLLYNSGAEFAQMSGSGSTVYGIFASEPDTQALKKQFPSHYLVKIVSPDESYY